MTTEQFANGAYTTLASAVTTGDSTISVSSAALFPAVPQFRIAVDRELMLVTSVSGTTFTVTRGIEGSAIVAHSVNAPVLQVITAGALTQFGADLFGNGTYALKPAQMTDAAAANNTIYFSTTAGKLVYKDSGGTVNNLY